MIHSLPDITGTGALQKISATQIRCNWFQVQANTGNTGTDNRVGDANISNTGTTQGAQLPTAGSQFSPTAGNTNCYDLSQQYVLLKSADKVSILYNVI